MSAAACALRLLAAGQLGRRFTFAMCCLVAAPLCLGAQSEASFVIYHGSGSSTRVAVDSKNHELKNAGHTFDLVLNPGAQVCMTVANGHPANYRYSLDVAIDTTKPELPDLGAITAFLVKLPGYVDKAPAKQAAARKSMLRLPESLDAAPSTVDDPDPKIRVYMSALNVLAAEVDSAKQAAELSDIPESFDARDRPDVGFRGAVNRLKLMSGAKFHFNDKQAKEHFDEELTRVREWAGDDGTKRLFADALAASSALLLATRDKLRADYSTSIVSRPRMCKVVAPGRNTITMAIARTNEHASRDTYGKDDKSEPVVVVNVDSRFQRKVVTLDPLTLAVFASDVPSFGIRNDTLRLQRVTNPAMARPAVMLHLNALSFGAADTWGLGAGVGIGFSSKDVVSDLLGGVTLSYRDAVRVGVGIGRSSQTESVKGVEPGQRIPADFGSLEDAIQTGTLNSKSWYLLVSIPGLTLVGK